MFQSYFKPKNHTWCSMIYMRLSQNTTSSGSQTECIIVCMRPIRQNFWKFQDFWKFKKSKNYLWYYSNLSKINWFWSLPTIIILVWGGYLEEPHYVNLSKVSNARNKSEFMNCILKRNWKGNWVTARTKVQYNCIWHFLWYE